MLVPVNGKAELVVQDVESYQQIPGRLDRFEAVETFAPALRKPRKGGSSRRGKRWQHSWRSLGFQIDITEAALAHAKILVVEATGNTTFGIAFRS